MNKTEMAIGGSGHINGRQFWACGEHRPYWTDRNPAKDFTDDEMREWFPNHPVTCRLNLKPASHSSSAASS
jgi:hypothetical protein